MRNEPYAVTNMTPKSTSTLTQAVELAEYLAGAAMVDARDSAAVGSMCVSKWLDLVRLGEAPQPVVRAPRFTRWRLCDVRQYFLLVAERGSLTANGSGTTHAHQASQASRAKRRTATAAA